MIPLHPKLETAGIDLAAWKISLSNWNMLFIISPRPHMRIKQPLVANITFPTGSSKKNPPTGFGSPSLFLGGTYYHVLVDWFVFTSHGAILTTSNHRTKIGDQFLYQFGFGRTIPSPEGWIYAWMIEIDGQYNKKNRIHGTLLIPILGEIYPGDPFHMGFI